MLYLLLGRLRISKTNKLKKSSSQLSPSMPSYLAWKRKVVVCWLVAECPRNIVVYLRDGSFRQLYMQPQWERSCTLTFYLTQSQYTDSEPTSFSAHPHSASHWNAISLITGFARPGKKSTRRNKDGRTKKMVDREGNYVSSRQALLPLQKRACKNPEKEGGRRMGFSEICNVILN